ncbi:hypothetical protein SDC9_169316 [bioreactor metagenome]|uniref:Uncharacterized protein n=1 Tax=bioreactor metagenome TaxID=1076179 RepID=A0A645GD42_9ZZZZ
MQQFVDHGPGLLVIWQGIEPDGIIENLKCGDGGHLDGFHPICLCRRDGGRHAAVIGLLDQKFCDDISHIHRHPSNPPQSDRSAYR